MYVWLHLISLYLYFGNIAKHEPNHAVDIHIGISIAGNFHIITFMLLCYLL